MVSIMRILLIYPEFPDTFWGFKHAIKFVRKRAAYPPLGLMTVGALLPKSWSKRLIDLNVTKLTDNDLTDVDYVFIGAMNVQRESARQVIERVKAAGVKIVAGGPLFTSEHEDFDNVDHFVLNEAELTLPLFLADLEKGSVCRVYKTNEFANIEKTPPPLWDLIDNRQYASMSIQFSRGCPFHCDFCNVTALFGSRLRFKDADQLIAEMDGLHKAGWRGQIFFVDDNFISNKKYLKTRLLPALIEWRKDKRGTSFNTEASIDIADDAELMKLMVEAGFDSVFIGIETPNPQSLHECNKKQNKNRDLVQTIKSVQRAGLQVQGGFIVGFDSDKRSIFQRQIEFIQESGIVTAMVGLLQAPAGTKLYERMKKEGRIIGHMSGDTDGTTNIIPKMGLDTLRRGYREILSYIYSPKNYNRRVKNFLLQYNAPKMIVHLDFQRVMALFRASLRIGVFSKQAFRYWELLLWTLVRRPRFTPLAITLAIYGYHFRKFSEPLLH